MDYTALQLNIIIISFAMILLSVFCVIFPQKLIHAMPHLVTSKLAKYSDITIRLFLGISLVLSADTAAFPLIFTLLGYLSLVAILALILLGTSKVELITKYITNILPVWGVRLVCVFSVLLFAFLIHNVG